MYAKNLGMYFIKKQYHVLLQYFPVPSQIKMSSFRLLYLNSLKIWLQIEEGTFGLDLAQVNASRSQLQESAHCCVNALSRYPQLEKKWVWPGSLDYAGLDAALSKFFHCFFSKAQQVGQNYKFVNRDSWRNFFSVGTIPTEEQSSSSAR